MIPLIATFIALVIFVPIAHRKSPKQKGLEVTLAVLGSILVGCVVSLVTMFLTPTKVTTTDSHEPVVAMGPSGITWRGGLGHSVIVRDESGAERQVILPSDVDVTYAAEGEEGFLVRRTKETEVNQAVGWWTMWPFGPISLPSESEVVETHLPKTLEVRVPEFMGEASGPKGHNSP